MFLVSYKCRSFPNLIFRRMISHSLTLGSNYYTVLGLSPSATQDQIKSSYFELCKKYHPDKNDGSPESVQKFRIIAEAYEILGNEKLRRQYDQKMFFNSGGLNYQQWKAHNRRDHQDHSRETHRVVRNKKMYQTFSGRFKMYDFDAWNQAHYPNLHKEHFERMTRHSRRKMKEESEMKEALLKKYVFLVGAFSFLILFYSFLPGERVGIFIDLPQEENESYETMKYNPDKNK